jgi:putative ABC transport system substrate-binding protein
MRYLITTLLLLCWFSCTAYAAPDKVILLETMPVPVVTNHTQAIFAAFEKLGYQDGGNIDVEVLQAQGSKELAIKLLKDSIASQSPKLVITVATLASQAAVEVLAGTNVPLIFCSVTDPVGSEIVEKLDAPNTRQITGVVFTQLHETKVEMVMRLLRSNQKDSAIKIGIVQSDYPAAVGDLREMKNIFNLSDEVELTVKQIPYEGVPKGIPSMLKNYRAAVDSIKGQVDFFWETSDSIAEVESFTNILIDSGVPLLHGHTIRSVQQGALITIRYDAQSAGELVVEMVDKVFKGQDAGSIPITVPKNFNLYINMKTADKLELVVPSHLLMIAGENVYR